MIIERNKLLAPFTTIGLGGHANYFSECATDDDLKASLYFSKENQLAVKVISGGSNIVFPDRGFDGLVIRIISKGITVLDSGESSEIVKIRVSAGEVWDNVVIFTIQNGVSGIECLSGIPGSAGATPVQNVGAYGQEAGEVIEKVHVIDTEDLSEKAFDKSDCGFGYRSSRFKSEDKGRYIITSVDFSFRTDTRPEIKYEELRNSEELSGLNNLTVKDSLVRIREAVLRLRKSKSMLIDPWDPNTKSCGSFFMNAEIDVNKFEEFRNRFSGDYPGMPYFRKEGKVKIPSAWLIEKSGFRKGYIYKGVGISRNHSLALINRHGTTDELLELAEMIRGKVSKLFGISLTPEPDIVK